MTVRSWEEWRKGEGEGNRNTNTHSIVQQAIDPVDESNFCYPISDWSQCEPERSTTGPPALPADHSDIDNRAISSGEGD